MKNDENSGEEDADGSAKVDENGTSGEISSNLEKQQWDSDVHALQVI